MASAGDQIEVVAVEADLVRPLRKAVLRPGTPLERLVYPHDAAGGATHAAVLDEQGEALAVGSVTAEGHPRDPRPGDWRVRGMATREDRRGQGLGRAVLDFLERHAREQGGRRLWCNARVGALRFYERAGYAIEGELFEIEGIGPHCVMSRSLG